MAIISRIRRKEHIVGFNPEEVYALLNLIISAYEGETAYMDGLFYCFQSSILGSDYGDLTGQVTGGWYAPEAKTFCETKLTPAMQKAYKETLSAYTNVYNSVVDAAKRWGATTGQVVSYQSFPFTTANTDVITVPDSKNGDVGIDPAIQEQLANSYRACEKRSTATFKENDVKISRGASFLGGNQYSLLVNTLRKTHDSVLTRSKEIYKIAYNEIVKSIEKYQQTAQSVAGSFK